MIGLDTNVIVRFLAQDDDIQSPIAARQFARLSREVPGFVSTVVLAEVSWVLSRSYGAARAELAAAIEGLLRSAELRIENAEAAWRALGVFQSGRSVEFADALIAEIAALAGASQTVTFDQRASAEAGMKLLA
ncbi:MAG: type II toxin-antitoxin system VapC family toxin [Parvularculaceae bacterium]|nr:type II toxin-antitoxin system VapC family toxin [Parvularculaceae bacterium]